MPCHAHDADDDSLAPRWTTTRPLRSQTQIALDKSRRLSKWPHPCAHGAATLIIHAFFRARITSSKWARWEKVGPGHASCNTVSELDALPIYEPRFLASSPILLLCVLPALPPIFYALPPPTPVQTESPAPWPAHALTCIHPACTLPRPPTLSAAQWHCGTKDPFPWGLLHKTLLPSAKTRPVSPFATLLPTRNLLLHPTLPIPVRNTHLTVPLGHPLPTSAPSRAQPLGYNP
ncbi:hypothetical protein COCC4DRAFT_178121 [Bipolaris maydis ATCC 48331]|uniref:Uncharacterized protein n=2 Tax=Cochliobolus heterostrophus TaxID=5016 RepID=M2V5F6_COCH5|nr:uncharacterized protein COCC4DRAFT_178121 [Bipolaris maydis ATCC 48331]EMD95197.1 hypothetical protein COCHEDRAFT_1191917 [Bipolaris maydis C5]ENI00911.1 hypothetical protein COCC4DRAFT_178121 [Bipolaris maydis ATCC 48331]KAJ6214218.1 hypothetical protein PSV09DRAFT_1191917 [Bipolaris maydis]